MNQIGLNGRVAIHEAIAILQSAGYMTERVIGAHKQFDLIGWKKGGIILCLAIRSSLHQRSSSYRDHIEKLTFMVRDGGVPGDGEIQLWVYRSPGWSRWKITPGGAIPVEWEGAR